MKNIGTGTRIFFATSRLVFAVECLFAVLFFPFVIDLGLQPYLSLPILFFAVALGVFCLPIIYEYINNRRTLTTGKYHVPLIISSLGFSFFTVLLFCISTQSLAVKAVMLFVSSFFAITFFFLYSYVNSSIGARLFIDKPVDRLKTLFSFVGTLVFITAFYLSDKFIGDVYRTTAAICGSVLLAAGFSVYLATHVFMPRFIKVNEPLHRGFRLMYTRFFSSFTMGENRRVYIGLFFNTLSILILAFCIRPIATLFGLDNTMVVVALFVFFAVFSIIDILALKRELTSNAFKIGSLICSVLVATVLVLRLFIDLDGVINLAAFLVLPLLAGTALGINCGFFRSELKTVRERSGSTPGIIANIKNIINMAAYLGAFIIVVLLSLVKNYSLYILMGMFVATAIVTFAINAIKKKYLTLEIPDEDV